MFIKTKERDDIPSDNLYVKYRAKATTKRRSTMMLLPGGPGGDHSIYSKQAEAFFEYADVIMFDPRGCGKSSLANGLCYAMDVYIDDVEDLRQQLDLDHIIVLGTSYGSMVAQGYAIKYGMNLQVLILVAGAASHEFIAAARIQLAKIGTKEQVDAFERLLSGYIETDDQLRDYFKTMAPCYSLVAKEGKSFHAANKKVRYNARAALAGFGPGGFLHSFDWREQLLAITCPTCIVVGERDWINRPEQAKEMHTLIAKSQLTIIPESGHFVWVDRQKDYLMTVVNFLEKIGV
ncbi:MAG: alpha/beta hydrolase [Pseudomonadota bacterium]